MVLTDRRGIAIRPHTSNMSSRSEYGENISICEKMTHGEISLQRFSNNSRAKKGIFYNNTGSQTYPYLIFTLNKRQFNIVVPFE